MDQITILLDRVIEVERNISDILAADLDVLGSLDAPLGIRRDIRFDLEKGRIINGYDFRLTKYSLGKNKIGLHLDGSRDMAPGHDSLFVGIDRFWWKVQPKKKRWI